MSIRNSQPRLISRHVLSSIIVAQQVAAAPGVLANSPFVHESPVLPHGTFMDNSVNHGLHRPSANGALMLCIPRSRPCA